MIMLKHMYIKTFLSFWISDIRQTGFFGKWQKLLYLLQQQKQTSFQYTPEAPTCNAATKHITSDVFKKHFMIHAFVQVKTQKQGFHNISHLQWHVYIKHPWNICTPPPKKKPKCNDPSEKAIIKITVDVN